MIFLVIRHKDSGIVVIQASAMTIQGDSVRLTTADGPREVSLAEIDWMSAVYVRPDRNG